VPTFFTTLHAFTDFWQREKNKLIKDCQHYLHTWVWC